MKKVHYRDILRCRENHMSQVQIAKACGCSRAAVQDVIKLAKEKGVTWDDVVSLSEKAAYELIRGKPRDSISLFAPIDYEGIVAEMEKDRTMTLSLLWEEYAALAARSGKRAYMYSRFCELYRRYCDSHELAITRHYVPGDLGEFDWAGKSMEVVDDITGEVYTAWLFVACLPYSQMVYVEAMPKMEIEYWCQASADAFVYFGGVPRLLTIDNLKTGVTTHTSQEIVLNRTYRDFAEHFNVAVIPHAVSKPRGKSSVESSVGKIANKIRNMLRNRTFFTFDELNEAIIEKLFDLNNRPFQKKAGSRWEKFEGAEHAALQPLPERPFEIARWGSVVTVPASYHVCCTQDGVYYSVPYRFAGQRVQARWTDRVFEVFCDGECIASHVRNMTLPKGEHVTNPVHRPKNHADFIDHDSAWFRKEAEVTGPSTLAVIESLLSTGIAEEQGWHWCEKLLAKREHAGADAVEEACSVALSVTPHPSYKTVNALIRNRKQKKVEPARPEDNQYAIRRFN